jgi:hypothetical protein
MAVITTGAHPKALWPGVYAWWGTEYKKIPTQWSQVFDKKDSDLAYEEMVEATGFGLAPIKSEGGAISYDTHQQGPTTRFTHVTYGLGYIVTREEMEDNKYDKLSRSRASALAFSMAQSKEVVHANIFNRAFTSTYAGGDGKELVATDHPTVSGTQSNELSPAADLSEAALETMLIQIGNAKNTRGLKIALKAQKLIVPIELEFEATRILNSTLRAGTANNDINAMRSMGMLPGGVFAWNYLTQGDDFFIKTNCPSGLVSFEKRAIEFKKDNDFDTENAKAKSTERYIPGWADWRSVYGSTGV